MSDGIYTRQGRCSAVGVVASTVLQVAQGASYGTSAGRVCRVSVIVAGTTAGGVFDSATIAGAVVGVQVFVIPNTVGVYLVDMPMLNGLTVVPGAGQTLAVSYD